MRTWRCNSSDVAPRQNCKYCTKRLCAANRTCAAFSTGWLLTTTELATIISKLGGWETHRFRQPASRREKDWAPLRFGPSSEASRIVGTPQAPKPSPLHRDKTAPNTFQTEQNWRSRRLRRNIMNESTKWRLPAPWYTCFIFDCQTWGSIASREYNAFSANSMASGTRSNDIKVATWSSNGWRVNVEMAAGDENEIKAFDIWTRIDASWSGERERSNSMDRKPATLHMLCAVDSSGIVCTGCWVNKLWTWRAEGIKERT